MLTREDYHTRGIPTDENEVTTVKEIIEDHGVAYPAVMHALRTEKLKRVGKVGRAVIICKKSADTWAAEYKLAKR